MNFAQPHRKLSDCQSSRNTCFTYPITTLGKVSLDRVHQRPNISPTRRLASGTSRLNLRKFAPSCKIEKESEKRERQGFSPKTDERLNTRTLSTNRRAATQAEEMLIGERGVQVPPSEDQKEIGDFGLAACIILETACQGP